VKALATALQTHYASDAVSPAVLLRITRRDGAVFAYTSHDEPITVGGVTYAAQGLGSTAFEAGGDFSVDNLSITTLDDGTIFTREAVMGGLWADADFVAQRLNWAAPGDGVETITFGTLGEIVMRRGQVIIELRSILQYLQQPVGIVTSKTCRARLGDAGCKVNLAPFTHSGTVTATAGTAGFTASALTQAADYFGEGEILWVTGPNAGLRNKIKTHATGGVFTLVVPMPTAITVGNTFSAIAGCRKRHERTTANPSGISDCITKFNNILNFQGEPHAQGVDALTAGPDE
jgi:uncharacterized phage protein (TIGR02218 family)